MKLKENLRFLRRKAGLTQAELAAKLKIKQYNISDYEIGRIEPNINTLIKLANVFHVSIDFLVGKRSKDSDGSDTESNVNDYITQMQIDKHLISINDAIKNLDEDHKKQIADAVNFLVDTFDK
ncbi:MAG: helix-turn-helix transcriptional regulator [Bacilli bacterium]